MINSYGIDEETKWFIGFIILMTILIILGFYFNVIIPLTEERNYIINEMRRSADEGEYFYWKRELKRLYLAYIPLIGRFFR